LKDVNQLITDHLDIWTSATEKKSSAGRGNGGVVGLYGIQKLRDLILKLAVRGKLVPQDDSEGSGAKLKERVLADRAGGMRAKRVRKQKPLPDVEPGEVPYKIPPSWTYIRLGDLTNYGATDKAEAKDVNEETWVLELEDIEKVSSRLLQRVVFAERRFKSSKNRFKKGDVIYGKLRPYLDKVLVADQDGVCTTEMVPMRPYADVSSEFVRIVLKTPEFIRYADDSTHGMNLPRLGTEKARMAVIPLPPTAEQHRIVAKVDELMRLCDALERQTEDSIKAHQTLVEVCLSALTNSQTPEELSDSWSRLEANFDALFTTQESVELLRKTVLQWAAMGRLCPQVSDGQTGTQIVNEVAKEKETLFSRGELRREKSVSPVDPRRVPHPIPARWAWAKVGEIALFTQYGTSEKARALSDGIPVLAMGNIQGGEVTLDSEKLMPRSWDEFPALILKPGDLLYNRTNSAELVGKTGLYEGPEDSYTFASYLIRIRLDHNLVRPKYLNFVMNSPYFRETQVVPHIKKQTGQANVNGTILKNMLVPVPPLKEQDNIIDRIDNLNRTCDGLAGLIRKQDARKRTIADCLTS